MDPPILFRRGGVDKREIRKRFRERLGRNGIVVAPGVFLPITAMLAAAEGFEAIYFGGAAFSNMLGLPDLGGVHTNGARNAGIPYIGNGRSSLDS